MNNQEIKKEIEALEDTLLKLTESIKEITKEVCKVAVDITELKLKQKKQEKEASLPKLSKPSMKRNDLQKLFNKYEKYQEFQEKFVDMFIHEADKLIKGVNNTFLVPGKKENPKKSDSVNHPSHYQGKMECIDAMEQEFGSVGVEWFCLLNAFKYEYRKGKKGSAKEDADKRNWYITKFNELRASRKKSPISVQELEKLVSRYK